MAVLVGCASTKGRAAAEPETASDGRFQLAAHGQQAPQVDTRGHGGDTALAAAEVEQSLQSGQRTGLAGPPAFPPLDLHAAAALPRDATAIPGEFRDLTEGEMLALAMANSPVLRPLGVRVVDNPAAATTVFDPAINANDPFFGPQAALAEFDSVLSASVNTQNNDRVFNNATLGGDVQQLVQDLLTLNSGWQRRTFSGAVWELNGINGYDSNNRIGNTFPSYWEAQLEAGVRQPLLQGGGREFNLIAGPNARPGFNFSRGVVLARLNNHISQADFAIQLRSFVSGLYSAYWDLDRQYRNYENVLVAQQLAFKTWQTVLARNQANVTGGEANKEAQARAEYYAFRREVLVVLGGQGGQEGLYVAERRLRNLIGIPIVDGQLLRPADRPPEAKIIFDYESLVGRAMSQRTELTRQGLRVQEQELRLLAAKNFLLPQMDLIGRYRLRGLGDDLFGSGPRFSSAYQDFYSFDHQEWEFGMEMGVVHGRRQAHAAVRHAHLQLSRERTILREQQRGVQHEISDAHAEVGSSYESMLASRDQVDAARQRLESSEALYQADKIQIEFLLDAQEELWRAQAQLATDQARYTMSLVRISEATGSLLSDAGVSIQQGCSANGLQYLGSGGEAESLPLLPAAMPAALPEA